MYNSNINIRTKHQRNTNNKHNLIFRNKIIKITDNDINLRSLALKCTFRLLLSGECQFFIFSRVRNENEFNENNLVCFISKEIDSSKIYVNFAAFENLTGNKYKLYTIKKEEVLNQKKYNKYLDVTEIYFHFIDNGDNNCTFYFPYQNIGNQYFTSDFYYPQFELCNLFIAVNGDLISIKEMNVVPIEKDIPLNEVKYKQLDINKSVCCLCF
jgi:hypothetical protein